ncbi:MAG: NAD(+)/NADH kinase [Actinomycetia bacterium]|nr:NAD(+)/NADH kinase [Actinomycetes bacterium]
MSSVLLVAHHDRLEAGALARVAADWLRAHGHEPWMMPDDAVALSLDDLVAERNPGSADLALSLGGDGTMLRTVKLLGELAVPIIGVNVGLLGYLTEVEPDSLCPALDRYFAGEVAGEWHIDERMLLATSVRRADEAPPTYFALNEAVIEKQDSGHTVRLQVWIDGAPFTSYAADGLILATPTGSTAYSMSARGPVLSPRLRAVLLTPVSPHMLFDRSLVIDPSELVEVEVIGHRSATLSIDGQPAATLSMGDRVSVAPARHVARFVRFGDRRFHQILKAKFGLADR